MPSTGTPISSSSVRSSGAPGSYTEAGPPERTSAFGLRRRTRSRSTSWGSSSAKTPHSRRRRAISCEYWPPKSSTRTSSRATSTLPASAPPSSTRGASMTSPVRAGGAASAMPLVRDRGAVGHGGLAVRSHADRLAALQVLALRLERRRHHDLRPVERGDVLVSAGGHRGAERAHQVERAVVLVRRAEQDLLERAVLDGGDAGAARQRGMERRHPPVVAATRGLLAASERRADHHGVGATGDGLGDVSPGPH